MQVHISGKNIFLFIRIIISNRNRFKMYDLVYLLLIDFSFIPMKILWQDIIINIFKICNKYIQFLVSTITSYPKSLEYQQS